jgi:rSAM/selenodomain-associated transferase 2
MMAVSIIVPVLDEAPAVEALLAELDRWPAAERVLVDGGSSDGTFTRLSAAASRHGLTVLCSPRGRAAQMDAGARAATGQVLLFLHADTRLPEHALEHVAAAVRDGAVGGCFRVRICSDDLRLRAASAIISARSRLVGSATGDQAIFVRRDVFERVGGFGPLPLFEDLELVRRVRAHGRFTCVPATVDTSARRWHGRGVTRTIALMWALRLGYHLGLSPARLARAYQPERH